MIKLANHRVTVSVVVTLLMLWALVIPCEVSASVNYVNTRNTIALVKLGSDRATQVTTESMHLEEFEHPIRVLSIDKPSQLQEVAETSIYLITIYVGHGTPDGLQLGLHIISWESLMMWSGKADLTFNFFAACYSRAAVTANSNHSYGFSGPIDARVAGQVTRVIISAMLGLTEQANDLFKELLTPAFIELWAHPTLPLDFGPWSGWTHDYFWDILITDLIYLAILFGVAWLVGAILGAISLTIAAATVTGVKSALGTIVSFLATFVIAVEYWYNIRYDPDTLVTEAQFRFKVLIPATHQYIWQSPVFWGWTNGHYPP